MRNALSCVAAIAQRQAILAFQNSWFCLSSDQKRARSFRRSYLSMSQYDILAFQKPWFCLSSIKREQAPGETTCLGYDMQVRLTICHIYAHVRELAKRTWFSCYSIININLPMRMDTYQENIISSQGIIIIICSHGFPTSQSIVGKMFTWLPQSIVGKYLLRSRK